MSSVRKYHPFNFPLQKILRNLSMHIFSSSPEVTQRKSKSDKKSKGGDRDKSKVTLNKQQSMGTHSSPPKKGRRSRSRSRPKNKRRNSCKSASTSPSDNTHRKLRKSSSDKRKDHDEKRKPSNDRCKRSHRSRSPIRKRRDSRSHTPESRKPRRKSRSQSTDDRKSYGQRRRSRSIEKSSNSRDRTKERSTKRDSAARWDERKHFRHESNSKSRADNREVSDKYRERRSSLEKRSSSNDLKSKKRENNSSRPKCRDSHHEQQQSDYVDRKKHSEEKQTFERSGTPKEKRKADEINKSEKTPLKCEEKERKSKLNENLKVDKSDNKFIHGINIEEKHKNVDQLDDRDVDKKGTSIKKSSPDDRKKVNTSRDSSVSRDKYTRRSRSPASKPLTPTKTSSREHPKRSQSPSKSPTIKRNQDEITDKPKRKESSHDGARKVSKEVKLDVKNYKNTLKVGSDTDSDVVLTRKRVLEQTPERAKKEMKKTNEKGVKGKYLQQLPVVRLRSSSEDEASEVEPDKSDDEKEKELSTLRMLKTGLAVKAKENIERKITKPEVNVKPVSLVSGGCKEREIVPMKIISTVRQIDPDAFDIKVLPLKKDIEKPLSPRNDTKVKEVTPVKTEGLKLNAGARDLIAKRSASRSKSKSNSRERDSRSRSSSRSFR